MFLFISDDSNLVQAAVFASQGHCCRLLTGLLTYICYSFLYFIFYHTNLLLSFLGLENIFNGDSLFFDKVKTPQNSLWRHHQSGCFSPISQYNSPFPHPFLPRLWAWAILNLSDFLLMPACTQVPLVLQTYFHTARNAITSESYRPPGFGHSVASCKSSFLTLV